MSLANLGRLTERRAESDRAWRAAVIAACAEHSIREVANHAGVSPARVHQILHGR